MLISCAASGVAENRRAATEAATAMNRTRQPPRIFIRSDFHPGLHQFFQVCISSLMLAGLAGSPFPARDCRRALCRRVPAWRPGAMAVSPRAGARCALPSRWVSEQPRPERALRARSALRRAASPVCAVRATRCARSSRPACARQPPAAAPFRRGCGRLRPRYPSQRAAGPPRCAAPDLPPAAAPAAVPDVLPAEVPVAALVEFLVALPAAALTAFQDAVQAVAVVQQLGVG